MSSDPATIDQLLALVIGVFAVAGIFGGATYFVLNKLDKRR